MHAFMNTAHGLLTNECTVALSMNLLSTVKYTVFVSGCKVWEDWRKIFYFLFNIDGATQFLWKSNQMKTIKGFAGGKKCYSRVKLLI